MADYFSGARLLVDRAGKHLDEMGSEIRAFLDRKPYMIRIEHDRQSGQYLHKLVLKEDISKNLSTILFDAINGLRSALDHAVYSATVAIIGGDPSGTKFPFGDDEDGFEGDMKRGCKHVPDAIKDTIRTLKPYRGGDDRLFVLNKIRNRKDHRHLIEISVRGDDIAIVGPCSISGVGAIFPGRWDATKKEIVFLRTAKPEAGYNLQVTPNIGIAHMSELAGMGFISNLEDVPASIIRAIDAIEEATLKAISS